MVGQRGHGQKRKQQVENVRHRLHRSKQSMLKGQLSTSTHQLPWRLYGWPPVAKFYGCLLWVQSDQFGWSNQKKTSFFTSHGLFCYKVMPFGLKNIGVTYRRLVNKMFAQQIGRNLKVYVNDMLIKSTHEVSHLNNLQETFITLRRSNMKLNPSKCVFGVVSRKFLSFMVSQHRVEESQRGTGYNGNGSSKAHQGSAKPKWQDCSP